MSSNLSNGGLYRCCFQDRMGNLVRVNVAAKDDSEAMELARSMSANSHADRFELWRGGCCVHIEEILPLQS